MPLISYTKSKHKNLWPHCMDLVQSVFPQLLQCYHPSERFLHSQCGWDPLGWDCEGFRYTENKRIHVCCGGATLTVSLLSLPMFQKAVKHTRFFAIWTFDMCWVCLSVKGRMEKLIRHLNVNFWTPANGLSKCAQTGDDSWVTFDNGTYIATIFCFLEYSSKKQISNVLPMHVLKVASSHNKTMHSNFCSHA